MKLDLWLALHEATIALKRIAANDDEPQAQLAARIALRKVSRQVE